jgi:hypothetical protein
MPQYTAVDISLNLPSGTGVTKMDSCNNYWLVTFGADLVSGNGNIQHTCSKESGGCKVSLDMVEERKILVFSVFEGHCACNH